MTYEKRPQIEPEWIKDEAMFNKVVTELCEYFAGSRSEFDIDLRWHGTDFQISVWKELLRIPYGKTVTYKSLAIAIGKPRAVRAVGTAVGRNPMCIIGPCHRVLPSNGGIGEYAGGRVAKRTLLTIESRPHYA